MGATRITTILPTQRDQGVHARIAARGVSSRRRRLNGANRPEQAPPKTLALQSDPALFEQVIDTDAELGKFLSVLQHTPVLAVDTEADSLHAYPEKVCLIQLTHAGGTI